MGATYSAPPPRRRQGYRRQEHNTHSGNRRGSGQDPMSSSASVDPPFYIPGIGWVDLIQPDPGFKPEMLRAQHPHFSAREEWPCDRRRHNRSRERPKDPSQILEPSLVPTEEDDIRTWYGLREPSERREPNQRSTPAYVNSGPDNMYNAPAGYEYRENAPRMYRYKSAPRGGKRERNHRQDRKTRRTEY